MIDSSLEYGGALSKEMASILQKRNPFAYGATEKSGSREAVTIYEMSAPLNNAPA